MAEKISRTLARLMRCFRIGSKAILSKADHLATHFLDSDRLPESKTGRGNLLQMNDNVHTIIVDAKFACSILGCRFARFGTYELVNYGDDFAG